MVMTGKAAVLWHFERRAMRNSTVISEGLDDVVKWVRHSKKADEFTLGTAAGCHFLASPECALSSAVRSHLPSFAPAS